MGMLGTYPRASRCRQNGGMQELWHGYWHWSEEQEQAMEDKRAVRILACPLKGCRRMRRCQREWPSKTRCPGFAPTPKGDEGTGYTMALCYFILKRSVWENQNADAETKQALKDWREGNEARRRKLAWERALEREVSIRARESN